MEAVMADRGGQNICGFCKVCRRFAFALGDVLPVLRCLKGSLVEARGSDEEGVMGDRFQVADTSKLIGRNRRGLDFLDRTATMGVGANKPIQALELGPEFPVIAEPAWPRRNNVARV